jgi:hypothetical protein
MAVENSFSAPRNSEYARWTRMVFSPLVFIVLSGGPREFLTRLNRL